MTRIGKLLRLPKADRKLLIEAWGLLLCMDLALRWWGWPHARRFAELPESAAHERAGTPLPVDRIVWLVAVAARYHLYPMRCLVQSMTLQRLLRRRGIQATLRIGVQKAGDSIRAHAWLEESGQPINARRAVEETFLPLVSASQTTASTTPARR